jgi:1-deoxyxylulose-5-phosphate synthase
MNHVDFGSTGLRVSRLAIGTGTHGWAKRSEQTALGIDGLADLLVRGLELGINFWDAADQYGSHPHVAAALKRIARDRVVIATKTTAKRGKEMTREIDRFLKELGTDVIDIVLLHGLNNGNWPKKFEGPMAALTRAQEAGKVRSVGLSCHGFGALRVAVTTPWVETVLVRINYAGVNMDGQPSEVVPVIESLHAAGKALYAMKVLGCGPLTHDVRRAFDYVLGLGTVHALSIGMTSLTQLQENVALMEELTPARPPRTA